MHEVDWDEVVRAFVASNNARRMVGGKAAAEVPLFVVSGQIGVGKSTALQYVQELCECATTPARFVAEPVAVWQKFGLTKPRDVLAWFYEAPVERAYHFQTVALMTRLRCIEEAVVDQMDTGGAVVTERLYEDWVFAAASMDEQTLSDYLQLATGYMRPLPTPRTIFHLTAPLETCMARIRDRSRDGETGVTMEYLALLESLTGGLHDALTDRKVCDVVELDNSAHDAAAAARNAVNAEFSAAYISRIIDPVRRALTPPATPTQSNVVEAVGSA